MQQWVKRVRAVIGMGFVWAVGGIGVAGVLELVDNVLPAAHPVTRLVDMWPQTLAILGFLGGTVFAVVLGIAGSRRRFAELSLAQFAACGAVAGLVLGTLAVAAGAGVALLGITTVASALAGAASLGVARLAGGRGLLAARTARTDTAIAGGETRGVLSHRD